MTVSDYKKPIPIASPESKPYWDALREHRLIVPTCKTCSHTWFPPTLLCPTCNSDDIGWRESSGRGKVYSYVVFHRVYHRGFAAEVPYIVALIELDEGPRLLSNVIGVTPEKVSCDMRVRVVYEDITDSKTLPKFIPDDARSETGIE
jgi:uncharacterized OB-fold protein